MRTFPYELRPPLGQRTSHRPSPHCTALVMLTVGADKDDGRLAERSGKAEGIGNFRQILILAPRAPVLAVRARILMLQDCPMALAFTAAGAGPSHQQHPCPRRLRGGEHERFGPRIEIKPFKAIEGPPAPVLDEDPGDAMRRCACNRVAAQPGPFRAEEALCGRYCGEVTVWITVQRERGPPRATAFQQVRRRDHPRRGSPRRAGELSKADRRPGNRANPRVW